MPALDVINQQTGTIPDRNASLIELLAAITGADIGLFGDNQPVFPEPCRRLCLNDPHDSSGDGACPLVRTLVDQPTEVSDQTSGLCEKGLPVAIHTAEAGHRKYLVIQKQPTATSSAPPPDRRSQAIALLAERCERLEDENVGLATEVIGSYEQLNVIFDITRETNTARDAEHITHFLMRRLAESLSCQWSFCLGHDGRLLWWSARGDERRDSLIDHVRARHADAMRQSLDRQAVLVFNREELPASDTSPFLLFGPIVNDENEVDLLVFGRESDRGRFTTGDMSIVDSILQHAQQVVSNLKLVHRLREMSYGAVRALVRAIDKKDNYTSGHSERVGFLSRLIGEEIGLSAEDLQDLEWAGLLHDVGKIGIQDGVLTKPGRLTEDEFDHIKSHVTMSYEIIAPIEALESVQDVVLYHHETPDGSGYPKGLQGDEIPLMARIVHVADTFDALTSTRSYRQAFSVQRAFEIMTKDKGTKLHADLVDAFQTAFQRFRAEQPTRFRELFRHFEEVKSDGN